MNSITEFFTSDILNSRFTVSTGGSIGDIGTMLLRTIPMLRQILFSLLFSLLLCHDTQANNHLDIQFYQKPLDDLHGHAYDVEEDQFGYLWISTAYGLKRYDGQTLIDFEPEGSEDLKTRQPHELTIVGDDLWVSTTVGVSRLNLTNYKYDHFIRDETNSKNTLSDNVILNMKEDNIGRLWMTSYNGITLFDQNTETFTAYPLKLPDGRNSKGVITTNIADTANGKIWVGSAYNGLFLFDPETERYDRFQDLYPNSKIYNFKDNDKISDLYVTSEGKLLITVGLYLLTVIDNKIVKSQTFTHQGENLTPGIIQENNEGNILVTFKSRGLAKIDGNRIEYLINDLDKHGLPNKKIYNFSKNIKGDFTAIYIDDYPRFYNSINDKLEKISISDEQDSVYKIISENNKGFIAQTSRKIVEYNYLTKTKKNLYESDVEIDDSAFISDHEIWVVTRKEIIKINPVDSKLQKIDKLVNFISHHSEIGVFAVMTRSYYIADNKTLKFEEFSLSASDGSISYPYSDRDTGIWFVSSNNIYLIKPGGERLTIPFQSKYVFSGANIIYRTGSLWIFGTNGFEKLQIDFSSVKPKVTNSEEFSILNGNAITTANFKGDKIYFNSRDGKSLFELDIYNGGYASIGSNTGLLGGRKFYSSGVVANSVYIAQDNNIFLLPNKKSVFPEYDSTLKVRSVYIEDKYHNKKVSYGERNTITLNPDDKFISIYFSDNNIETLGILGVQVMLEGRDSSWHNISENHISYSSLEPGDYTFRLRSKFIDKNEYDLKITVVPPWWRTVWAYSIYTLITLLLVYLYFRLWNQKQKIKKISENKMRIYAKGFEHAAEGFCIVDKNGTIKAKNIAFQIISRSNIDNIKELRPRSYEEKHFKNLWKTLLETGFWSGKSHIRGRYEEEIPVECVASRVEQDDSNDDLYVLLISDITLRVKQEKELRMLANYDSLTGLANRNLLYENIRSAIKNSEHLTFKRFSLFYIDIDRFKLVNDSLNHENGDDILKETSHRLQSCVRDQDFLARFGSDEFCMIIENIEDVTQLAHIAKKILETIEVPYSVKGEEVSVTVSIGISVYKIDSEDVDTLIKQADAAVHSAKSEGGGKFQFYTESMNSQSESHLRLETDMRKAVRNLEFISYFQPKVCLGTGRMVAAEALVRWNRSQEGIQSPDSFIDAAERTGVIQKIGRLVIQDVCLQIQQWWDQGIKIPIAVNLSVKQIIQDDFISMVKDIVGRYSFDRSLLEFEITENLLMNDREKSVAVLSTLKDQGHSIYIDDFGTGYSSLSYLADFPIDYLKIDQVFVKDLLIDNRKKSIVNTIIELANNLGLKVVAEGVEQVAVHEYLKALGCHYAQGFYYAHPQNPEEMMASELFIDSYKHVKKHN